MKLFEIKKIECRVFRTLVITSKFICLKNARKVKMPKNKSIYSGMPLDDFEAEFDRRGFLKTGAYVSAGVALGLPYSESEAKPKIQGISTVGSQYKAPRSMLVKNASVLVTMDSSRREIKDAGLYLENGVIKQVGATSSLPSAADEILDLKDHIVVPGLVNTHHHLYQHLTRAVPAAQDGNVWNWLKVLYPIWARMKPNDVKLAIQVGLAELALSGCTTVFDHQYVFPNGCSLDDSIHTAANFGIRFHASRGSMSLGVSKGGLPPDSCVEDEVAILKDCQRVIELFHDNKSQAMTRVVLAPCSPFSVTEDLMVQSAKMARHYNVGLHTHLAESLNEERYTLEKYKLRPVELMEKFGWVGKDVWFAHSIHVNDSEIDLYARTGCGVAHCPCSNMRLASGIAPIKKYRNAGVKVGIGVDGSSSNDGSHMLGEVRQAMLLARLLLSENPGGPPDEKSKWMSARDVLEMATVGGASVLGRDDIGSLEPGKCADFFAVDLNKVGFAGGSMSDPVSALIFCAPTQVDYTVVNGRCVVKEGQVTTIDLPNVMADCSKAAINLING